MEFYLTGYIGTGAEASLGVPADPFRPNGTDGQASWSSIDLRPNSANVAGKCFLAVPVRDDAGIGGRYLGQDPLATVPAIVITRLGNDLGITLTSTTFDQLLLEILTVQARDDGSRWRPLRATNRRQRIWLRELIVDIPVVAGGATYTESFNTADSTTLGPDLTWTETTSTVLEVRSNKAAANTQVAQGRARAESDMLTNDNYAQAVWTDGGITSTSDIGSVICRYQSGANTGYIGAFGTGATGSGDAKIFKIVAGATTQLASYDGYFYISGDLNYIEADGSSITQKSNGGILQTITDTAITTGTRGGIGIIRGFDVFLDSFEMGDLVTNADPTVRPPPQLNVHRM